MSQPQSITATEARNNFFSLIDQSMFEGKRFIVEKNGRPWAELRPPQSVDREMQRKSQLILLKKISGRTLKMSKSDDSVPLIKEMRLYGK